MKARGPRADARRKVGRYRLERPLGSGASATVYLARLEGEAGFARDVALKLVHAPLPFSEGDGSGGEGGDEADVGQPLVEARIASRIRHPNVVPVLDMGRDEDDRVYLVMEYVEGQSLNALLRRSSEQGEPIPLGVALAILDDLLAGLHAAHEARGDDGAPLDLVHRDVSPHNVIVGVDGVARLTDFGIAKVTDATLQTAAGIVKGKPGYMAPEQLRGTGIDRRTDVWAAGVIAWELLAGRRLYRSKDLMSLSLEIVTTTPPGLAGEREGLPAGLDRAVARALARDSRDRWASAEAFRQAVAAVGLLPARRDAVAACVRGDGAPRPSQAGGPAGGQPRAELALATEEGTATVPMTPAPTPTVRTSVPASSPFEGATEATASVSTLEAAGVRAGVPWRGIALVAAVIGAGATFLLVGGGEGEAPSTSSPRPVASSGAATQASPSSSGPRAATTVEEVVEAAPAAPDIDLDAELPTSPEATSSASAAASSPASASPRLPPRGKPRPPARPPAAPAPSGKLMDSPYR